MLDIFLIRHAESTGNINNHLIGGRSNHLELSERGILQAQLLARRLMAEDIHFDAVYSSTATRALHTASILRQEMGLEALPFASSPALLELCQGDWVGQQRKLIYNEDRLVKILENPWEHKAPNGESQRDVEERMYHWMEENLLPDWEKNRRVAVVSHGMAIKCLLRKVMNADPAMTYKIIVDNTSITRFKYDRRGWHLERVNDCAHLHSAKVGMISYHW